MVLDPTIGQHSCSTVHGLIAAILQDLLVIFDLWSCDDVILEVDRNHIYEHGPQHVWRVELATRRSGSLLPAEVLNLAFSMELGTVPALDKVDLVNGDLALVELARIEPGKLQNLSSSEQAAMTTQLARLQGQLSMLEYRSALRASAAIVYGGCLLGLHGSAGAHQYALD